MASGTIEITMPLRRVVLGNGGEGGWLHSIYGYTAVVELDDGRVVHVTSDYVRFVEPYSKETVYENPEITKAVSLALKYKDLLNFAEEARQWIGLKTTWTKAEKPGKCRRCGEERTLHSEDKLCADCWDKLWYMRNILGF